MKKLTPLLCALLIGSYGFAQTPADAPLPEIFDSLRPLVSLVHFPDTVYASKDADQPGTFFWKHNTTIFHPHENLRLVEGGAYIFYNNRWNLRIRYSPEEFAELFAIPNALLKAGQPYTFADNWRTDHRLLEGWAMWYVVALTEDGEKVYGVGKLLTAGRGYPQCTTSKR